MKRQQDKGEEKRYRRIEKGGLKEQQLNQIFEQKESLEPSDRKEFTEIFDQQ